MDLLKAINQNIKLQESEIAELQQFVTEMEELESKNLFHLNEIFGGESRKEKQRRQEALARTAARGKSGRAASNAEGGWKGGQDSSGRLAELLKLFGTPVFNGQEPPQRPNGMTLEDYKIWITGAGERAAPSDNGPAIGPEVGNIIRKNGVLYQVTSSSNLSSIAQDKEGRKIKVDWATLGKPVAKGGMTLYEVS